MSEARVLLEVKNKIAYVSLNRPEKHNGLDMAMFKEMIATAKKIRKNRAIRAVIMHGNGPSFCAGLDFLTTFFFPFSFIVADTNGIWIPFISMFQ